MKDIALFFAGLCILGGCTNTVQQETAVLEQNVSGKKIDPPIMGWSSWNTYRVHINDSLIMKQADALVTEGLKDVGYTYINIDDGFFGFRDEQGKMHTHPERFPNGLKGVVNHIHGLGLNAGIYSDAGSNTCGSIWDNDQNGVGSGLYGHEKQDADFYFKELNFNFIKIDYCGAGQELNLDEEKRYTEIKKAFEEVGAQDVSMNICRWAFPGTWAAKLARSWRISGDISPNWNSVKYIIGKNMYLSAYCGDGHYNDMDMLEIGRGLTPEEEEVHFGMWCLMSSPLLIGCDLTTIPESSLRLLKNKELIALNQDPLGLQAYVVQHQTEDCYVFVKDILTKRGTTRAVALLNMSDKPADFTLPMEAIELGGQVQLRDLVHQLDLDEVDEVLRKQVAPHSVLILKAEGERRLEPVRYEVEWGYMPCFQDLMKTKKDITFLPNEQAGGQMVIRYLGGRKENVVIWPEVYSETGGQYAMTIYYAPGKYRKLEVSVNDKIPVLFDKLETESEDQIKSVTLDITLQSGYNKVMMGSSYCWAPDIDGFTLKKK